jgi:AraC-like DNA-binding protein
MLMSTIERDVRDIGKAADGWRNAGDIAGIRPVYCAKTLPFDWAGKTATVAAARGVPIVDWLLEENMGGPAGVITGQTNLSVAEYVLMCVGIINLVDDEVHGVSRGRIPRGTHSTGLRIMASARTLRTAIEALRRFSTLIGHYEKISLATSGSTAQVQIAADVDDPTLSASVEEMVAVALHCQFSFILDQLLPLSAFVTTGDHPFINKVHPYLGCTVLRGKTTAIVFPASCLDLEPVAKIGDTPITDSVLGWLKLLDARTRSFAPHSRKPVTAAVYEKLQQRDISYAECSVDLRLPGDELRRALSAEGSGYRSLRHSALLERLRPHLVSGSSLDDVALALGFSDARSLRRSVRSASGLTVTELRMAACMADSRREDLLLIGRLKRQLDAMN